MSEQEQKVLRLCRKWYSNAENITMQTLWYEIGVMVENEQPSISIDTFSESELSNDEMEDGNGEA